MPAKIQFKNHEIKRRFRDTKYLKHKLEEIFINEGVQLQKLTYIFCSDNYLLDLNIHHLNHSTFTDILTFDLSESSSSIIAEIYISVERVAENSPYFGTSLNQELRRVMIHGILHLCGYNDHLDEEKLLMRQKEDYYLATF